MEQLFCGVLRRMQHLLKLSAGQQLEMLNCALYIGNSGLSAGGSTNSQGHRLPEFASFDKCVLIFSVMSLYEVDLHLQIAEMPYVC